MKKATFLLMVMMTTFSSLTNAGTTVVRKSAASGTTVARNPAASGTRKVFERISTCDAHYIETSGYFAFVRGVDAKTATAACSLAHALEDGRDVCEGSSDAYLRNGETFKYVRSTISPTVCSGASGDYVCDTKSIVECK
jgi:ABC-type uncharacterized transport system YnjBCD substrate-binding protein